MQKNENAECEMYRGMLYDYASDNLSEQDKADFLLHINNCPECKRELAELEAIMSATAELEKVEVPDSLRSSVSEALAAESAKIRRRRSFRRRAVETIIPIAACAAIAIGIYSGGIYDKFTSSDKIITPSEQASPPPQTEENVIPEETEQQPIQSDSAPTRTEDVHDSRANNVSRGTQKHTAEKNTSTSNKTVGGTVSEPAAQSDEISDARAADASAASEAESPETSDKVSENTDNEASVETNNRERVSSSSSSAKGSAHVSGGGGSSGGSSSGSAGNNAYHLPEKASATAEESEAPAAYAAPESSAAAEYDEAVSSDEAGEEQPSKAYCTVVVDNPSEFAEGFGISGKSGNTIYFEISASRWREFVNYCRSNGAYVNADFSGDYSSVSITVTNNK